MFIYNKYHYYNYTHFLENYTKKDRRTNSKYMHKHIKHILL